jgi:hypothetical protein
VWLSKIPCSIPDHFIPIYSEGEVRAAFEYQGAHDWETFLSLRAIELRSEGRLVVVLPALDDTGSSGFDDLMHYANAVLADMVDRCEITAGERSQMVLPTLSRKKRELLAPFSLHGHFQGLVVEHCDVTAVADAAWVAFQQHENGEATFMPSLATALSPSRSADERRAFANLLEERLKRRLLRKPAPLDHFVATFVVAKKDVEAS